MHSATEIWCVLLSKSHGLCFYTYQQPCYTVKITFWGGFLFYFLQPKLRQNLESPAVSWEYSLGYFVI